jgi:syntaxin 7
MSEYVSLLINEEDIIEREDAIDNIHQEMLDIHEIFKTLATLSHEQGYLIDNIETNIDNVVIHVQQADQELDAASKKQQKRNICLWYIFFILLIIVLVITLILVLT